MNNHDPVCGMSVDLAATPHIAEYAGSRYGFCCGHCRDKFLADPEHYLKPPGDQAEVEAVSAAGSYICPMDPEVSEDRPPE